MDPAAGLPRDIPIDGKAGWRAPARLARVCLGLALLAAIVQFAMELGPFFRSVVPIVRLWSDPDAQYRMQLGAVPYDLLRSADALLPRWASTLLVTPGRDVRHLEYTTYHRALYFLAPRPVWWLAPTPPDGTWESRWWISAPLTPEAVRAVAVEKGATHVLAIDVPSLPLDLPVVADWPDGRLLRVGRLAEANEPASASQTDPRRKNPSQLSAFWPARLVLAIASILAVGSTALAITARIGFRPGRIEGLSLAWIVGAGLTSVAMLWLDAAGIRLHGQVAAITFLGAGGLVGIWKSRLPRPSSPWSRDGMSPAGFWGSPAAGGETRRMNVMIAALLLILALQGGFVALLALGRPLDVWDSWVNWGMKARTLFVEGGITPALYADPSRDVTMPDYPLLVPLLEAWVYRWMGSPDDRFAGAVVLAFYLSLAGLAYGTAMRHGATRTYALTVAAVVATVPHVAGLAGAALTDLPLAAFAVAATLYLLGWLEDGGPPGTLAIAALAAGMMPWTKREGVVLLLALCLTTVATSRGSRRAWRAAAALAFAGALVAGPWWVFTTGAGISNANFLPVTAAALGANLGRLPTIAGHGILELLNPRLSFLWPLAVLFAVAARGRNSGTGDSGPRGSRDLLLPVTALVYLCLMGSTYVFSAYVPYQRHIASSFFRIAAQVVPLSALWIAQRGLR